MVDEEAVVLESTERQSDRHERYRSRPLSTVDEAVCRHHASRNDRTCKHVTQNEIKSTYGSGSGSRLSPSSSQLLLVPSLSKINSAIEVFYIQCARGKTSLAEVNMNGHDYGHWRSQDLCLGGPGFSNANANRF